VLFAIEAVVSGAGYLALALTMGVLLAAGFLLPDRDDAMRRKLAAAVPFFVGAFLLIGILAVAVQGAKLSAGAFPSLDIVIRYLTRTQSGKIWLMREIYVLFLLVMGAVLLRKDARAGKLRLLFFLVLPLVATRGLTGHAVGAGENRVLMIAADTIHMIGVALWAGGLPVLFWMLWKGAGQPRASTSSAAEVVRRFSRVALVSVCLLVPSGLYQSVTHVGGLSALLNTAYGNLLTFKLALVGLMLALGALNRFSTKPALARAASSATAEPRAAKAYLPIGWEGALGMSVLVVTGFLTTLPPGVHSAHNLTQRQDGSTPSPAHSHAPANLLAPAEGAAVKIVTPRAGQAYNGDSVPLEFTLKKGKRGEHVHAYIDGEIAGMFKTTKGKLTGIKPGEHTLELRVVTHDHKTELDATDKVRFTVK